MKTILCYGDSLTYGANPTPGGARHAFEDRLPSALEAKLAGIELMNDLGIEYVNVGLPSASARAFTEALELCRAIAARGWAIRPVCAGRTLVSDVSAIVEVSQRAGRAVEASLFVGSSRDGEHQMWTAPLSDTSKWTQTTDKICKGTICRGPNEMAYDPVHHAVYAANWATGLWRLVVE